VCRKIAIINIGANRNHWRKYHLLSPLFEDGNFRYVPAPEEGHDVSSVCPRLPTYRELFKNDERILQLIPDEYRGNKVCDIRVHHDPEFETFTYGDYPCKQEGKGRAGKLVELEKDDFLFFFARLTEIKSGKPTDKAGLFFIGFFEIEQIKPRVTEISKELLQTYERNVHVIRAQHDSQYLDDGSWLFKGSIESRRFQRPVKFTREITEQVVISDNKGIRFTWSDNPSRFRVQQGGRTRPCRFIDGGLDGKRIFLEHILKFNDVPLFSRLLNAL
jgi:hypothetical protein